MPLLTSPEASFADAQTYLQEVANQLSYADAAEAIGYKRKSFNSVKDLYADYGVVPPERKNQHSLPAYEESSAEAIVAGIEKVAVTTLSQAARKALNLERAIVVSDIHAPFHDPRAIAVALALIADLKPEVIYLAGDIWDAYAISRWSKDPKRALMLDEERNVTVEILRAFREAAGPDCRIVFIEGNHEVRLAGYLQDRFPAGTYLPELALPRFLKLDELDIEFIPMVSRTAYAQYGPIKVGHFEKCNKHSAYTAKLLMDDYMCDLLQAHTHRLGTHYRTIPGKPPAVAGELGCLCDLNPGYVRDPNWQHGITVITKHVDGDRFHISQIPIVDYACIFNDRLYAA